MADSGSVAFRFGKVYVETERRLLRHRGQVRQRLWAKRGRAWEPGMVPLSRWLTAWTERGLERKLAKWCVANDVYLTGSGWSGEGAGVGEAGSRQSDHSGNGAG